MAMEPFLEPAFLRKLDRLSLVTRRAMAGNMQGERRSPRRGSSVEFADFRPYTPGDDIRQIDWNLYARMERFFLKLFVAEEELTVHLLLDTSASMNWGEPNKFHYACRAAGALGYLVLNSLDRVSVTAFGAGVETGTGTGTGTEASHSAGGYRLPGVRGKRGAFPLFHFLQKLPPGGATNLAQACHRYARTERAGGPLVFCSDLLDPGWKEGLRVLSSRPFDMTLLHVLAPQELDPQIDGDFRLLDSEGGPPVEVTADLDLLHRYQENLVAWRREVETFCATRSISYLFADTSITVEDFVLSQVRARGVVR
ncbi:MAG: DUF58 domain-containing protein [Chloroflexaceae bacterium]|nr:DUF58 domain-containing protein [Chloroflexaceae bacterium]